MNSRAADLGGGVPLGGQQVNIREIEVGFPASVDIQDGGILPGPFTHHLRVVIVAQGKALLIPCDAKFLQTIARSCNTAAGIPQPHNTPNEE